MRTNRRKTIALVGLLAAGIAGGAWAYHAKAVRRQKHPVALTASQQLAGLVRQQRSAPPERFIAHALGEVNGKFGFNSKEGFEANYRRGYRYFEADFLFSSDGELVCMHDGYERAYRLPKPFTLEQFRKSRPGRSKTLTPLTGDDLLELLRGYPDTFLITDVKEDNGRALRMLLEKAQAKGMDLTDRIIPQIYGSQESVLIDELPYKRWILTLYRMGPDYEAAKQMLNRYPQICAITLPVGHFIAAGARSSASTRDAVRPLAFGLERPFQAAGVPVFVHTVNVPAEANLFLDRNIGIYTDNYIEPSPAAAAGTKPAPTSPVAVP